MVRRRPAHVAQRIDEGLRALGFGAVSLDLRPFRSGSLSRLSRGLTEPEPIP